MASAWRLAMATTRHRTLLTTPAKLLATTRWPATCHCHQISTTTQPKAIFETNITQKSAIESLRRKVGWMKFSKARLSVAAALIYESVVDNLDYMAFFKEYQLPDTLYSWYLVSELHVWMLSVRLLAEDGLKEEGVFVRARLLEIFWEDMDNRMKALPGMAASLRKQYMADVFEQFQAALFLYDEGILSDDTRLANALWRRLLDSNVLEDPGQLESLVAYVRRTVFALDSVPFEDLIKERKFRWLKTPRSLS